MDELRKAAEMALETLERLDRWLALRYGSELTPPEQEVVKALRQALAQPEQEPALWMVQYKDRHEFVWGSKPVFRGDTVLGLEPLYTAPPKREWVGLTDDEIDDWFFQRLKQAGNGWALDDVVRAIEAKLKEKNRGGV